MRVCLGLDTSCYTASLAAVTETGEVVFNSRVLLTVAPGQCGLRQSDALFQHLQRLESMTARWRAAMPAASLLLVAASVSPRPVPDSYLPVFLAGTTVGRAMAAAAGVPFFATTHQEGHLQAAFMGLENPPDTFLAVHLSGGTTEILTASRAHAGFGLELLGGTEDLYAGQFIDRLGAAMGLPFPAGPALEELAARGRAEAFRLPVASKGLHFSLSGPLTAAERALRDGVVKPEDLAASALVCLSEAVIRMLRAAIAATGLREVVLGGGVMANRRIRALLTSSFPEVRLIFASPEASTDNAIGVALLGLEKFGRR